MEPIKREFEIMIQMQETISQLRADLEIARSALEKYRGQVNQYGEHTAADDLSKIAGDA